VLENFKLIRKIHVRNSSSSNKEEALPGSSHSSCLRDSGRILLLNSSKASQLASSSRPRDRFYEAFSADKFSDKFLPFLILENPSSINSRRISI
jgi:hypothetical protein